MTKAEDNEYESNTSMKHFVNNSSNKQVNTSSTVGGFDISFESKENKNKNNNDDKNNIL